MNKYEKLFHEVVVATKNNEIHWVQQNRFSNQEFIFNVSLVHRQFKGEFAKKGELFNLLLVEKKYADPQEEYLDRWIPELHFLSSNELVFSITDSVVERDEFYKLVELVESKNAKAKKLFD